MHVLVGYISISRFHAVDSKNGSGADLIITVKICQCSGHGECDFEHSLPDYTSSDTFQLTYCSCELQWTGEIIIILVVSTHVGLVSLSFVWTSPWHFCIDVSAIWLFQGITVTRILMHAIVNRACSYRSVRISTHKTTQLRMVAMTAATVLTVIMCLPPKTNVKVQVKTNLSPYRKSLLWIIIKWSAVINVYRISTILYVDASYQSYVLHCN